MEKKRRKNYSNEDVSGNHDGSFFFSVKVEAIKSVTGTRKKKRADLWLQLLSSPHAHIFFRVMNE